MWKKEDTPSETPTAEMERPTRPERPTPPPTAVTSEQATIGRSITVRGDVSGDEDLVIQGRVEGSVDLEQHSVTVGPAGVVNASIIGRVVTVEGRVEGNINAEEQAILRSSASVHGDITAPRVVLENGARFRGGVDMGDVEKESRSNSGSTQSRPKRSEPSRPTQETAVIPPEEKAPAIGKGSGPVKGNGPAKDAAIEMRS